MNTEALSELEGFTNTANRHDAPGGAAYSPGDQYQLQRMDRMFRTGGGTSTPIAGYGWSIGGGGRR